MEERKNFTAFILHAVSRHVAFFEKVPTAGVAPIFARHQRGQAP